MINGAGVPVAGYESDGAQSAKGGAVLLSPPSSSDLLNSSSSGFPLDDLLDLSNEARARLRNDEQASRNLEKGRGDLVRDEAEFLKQQLAEIKEQADFLEGLLANATPDQASTIRKGLEQLGENLNRVGRQLGLLEPQGLTLEQHSTSIEAGTITASFNTVATLRTADGRTIQYEQQVDLEFSYFKYSSSSSSVSLSDDGTIQAISKQSSLVAAQLNISSETSIVALEQGAGSYENAVQANTGNRFEDLAADFHKNSKSFTELIAEFEEQFTDEERLPPRIYNMIKKFLEKSPEDRPIQKVDQVA